MRIRKLFLTVAIAFTAIAASAQTNGFSYQAVVRDSKGELVSNKSVGIQLTIANSDGSNVMYSETQTAQTNAYGVLSVTVGSGTPQNGGSLSNVDWAGGQAWLHVGIDVNGGSSYTSLGATKIQAVPVALYAANGGKGEKGDPGEPGQPGPQGPKGDDGMQVSGTQGQTLVHNGTTWVATDELSVKKLDVVGTENTGDALFEVKDNDGNVVFAVYPNEVRVYVDENDSKDSKVKRSGLIVTGRNTKGDGEQDYLIVNPTGTQVIVDENDGKAKRSGLIVTGRNTKDDAEQDYLVVNPNGTKVIVDEGDGKVKRSGLVVTGRNTKGDGEQDYLVVDPSGTQVIVDDELDNDSKVPRSGFVVTGRNTKDDSPTKYLKVATDGTLMHFDKSDAKVKRSGLIVTGRNTKGTDQEYFNIDAAQDAKTLNEENRIYWYPERNAFMAGKLKVNDPTEVGENSFNAGYLNKASGDFSQAFGYQSEAIGETSIAIGNVAKATGKSSFAFGESTTAAGESSVAIGVGAQTGSSAKNAFAFGEDAQASGSGSYAIGSGANATGTSSYAFGSEGIDTTGAWLPAASATGEFAYAFGAGTEAIGKAAMAFGVYTTASGEYSTAMGTGTTASGEYSTTIGIGTDAIGEKSTAMGYFTTASGNRSTAIGDYTTASGQNSTAFGWHTTASGQSSMAMGYGTNASGRGSIAMGNVTTANGYSSIAMGYVTTASGDYSTAMGAYTKANNTYQTVVGKWNTGSYSLFAVGNGNTNWNRETQSYDTVRSDAFVVFSSGDSKFNGSVTYTGNLTHDSDSRLKKDVQTISGALDKVLKLRGVTYYWKTREEMAATRGVSVNNMSYGYSDKLQTGVVAQEIEQVMPELVSTDEAGFKSVDYVGITPLLIEAIKEQQTIINNQQQQIDELKKMVEELLNKQ